jgi:D-alanyl-lipoteichoic acid acyltransferase DltB (MBOAT superfamily)
MHFLTEEFLLFSLCFGGLFFLLNNTGQKLLLLAGSFVFVGFHNVTFALLLAFSIAGNYLASVLIERNTPSARAAMWGGIALNAGLMGVFKYFDFFSTSLNDAAALVGVHYSPLLINTVVPLGLSFYSFQAISYLADLKHGKLPRASLLDYAVYMAFWPKFVAGPIIRATSFMPQLRHRRRPQWRNLFLGLESIIYGLFLKAALSDFLMPQVQKVYNAPAAFDGANALVAALFFTFQIYGDFAGYSLVVIGLARIMGYHVRPNFLRPNFARSFSDFWRRWHISLSTWLDTYIFRNLVPRPSRGAAAQWPTLTAAYAAILGRPRVEVDDTFLSLSGDSLSFVQVALAIETHLGYLPDGWDSMTVSQLDALRPATL